ncbi:MAG: aminotransferase class III-fold pyridoxal phosphate-dependent enzyme, partial [Elusimicrobia bacterium]|nr:aminotransferase class III-fold pyridoxal phosphate-dependent enzyme [Elusimicrobiota bacterium]
MKVSAQDILKESEKTLGLIAKHEALTEEERARLTDKTAAYYAEHVNPGILEYRKAVSTEYISVEWADGANSFTDINGKTYIDLLGGYGIFNVGHRHPKVVEAVTHQLKRQALHSQELLEPFRAILAKLVRDITPGDLQFSFFGNSGAEAVEGAMKLAMLHTGRKSFVAAV